MTRIVILITLTALLGGCYWGPGWEGRRGGHGGSDGERDGGGGYHHGAIETPHVRSAA